MSNMAGNAARVAVERSGSCRDTRRINFLTFFPYAALSMGDY